MVKRWKYINLKGYFDFPLDDYIREAKMLEDEAKRIFYALLKCYMTNEYREQKIKNIINSIEEIRQKEEEYLTKLINQM